MSSGALDQARFNALWQRKAERADLAAKADQSALDQLALTSPRFVTPAGSMLTVDQLLADYPASAARRGMYARVSDYGGYVDRVLRCDFFSDVGYYQWTPTLPEYGRSMPITGDMTLWPLKSPTSIILTGTIPTATTRRVTLETTNGRPGEIKEIKAGLTSLLGTLNILGTGLGSGVSLLLGGYQKFVLDSSGGALAWVRMV